MHNVGWDGVGDCMHLFLMDSVRWDGGGGGSSGWRGGAGWYTYKELHSKVYEQTL